MLGFLLLGRFLGGTLSCWDIPMRSVRILLLGGSDLKNVFTRYMYIIYIYKIIHIRKYQISEKEEYFVELGSLY